MIRKYKLAGAFLLCTIVFLILVFLCTFHYLTTPKTVHGSSVTLKQHEFVLKEYQGKIAVYLPNVSQPMEILDIDVSLLPNTDIIRLHQGIEVKDREQLIQLIHELDS